jgi:hypothetical protein
MDLLAYKSSRRHRWVPAIFLFLFTGLLAAHGYAPTILLGVYGQGLCYEGQDMHAGVRGSALLSWRALIGENASLALYARSVGDYSPLEEGRIYDSHDLSFDTLIRGEGGRILLEGGLLGSGNGTIEGQAPYLRPDWRIGYTTSASGGNGVLPSFAYSGYYSYRPEGTGDSLFQGLTLGLAVDPSIRIRYGLEILGGWERWTEEKRNDFLGSAEVSAGGLVGYFHDWSVAAEGGMRWSEQSTESNLYFALESGWAWTPHRQLSLELGAFAREELYLWPETAAAGYDVFATGLDFRGDWTPDDRVYLVTELSAARRFADDPVEERWRLIARTGVEFSFW